MTAHRRRARPANGYRADTIKPGRVAVVVRLDPADFERVRELALARGLGVSEIIRGIVAARLAPAPHEPSKRELAMG